MQGRALLYRPAREGPRLQLQRRCYRQPSFGRSDEGEVGSPLLVRAVGLQLTAQHGNRYCPVGTSLARKRRRG